MDPYHDGEIELASDLNLRPDRYFLATRLREFSDIKVIVAGRSNAGGPILSLIDPKFEGSEYASAVEAKGFGGLLGASESPIYWEILERLMLDRSVALVWNGSEPYIDFMLYLGVDFDYYPHGYENVFVIDEGGIVPESLIIETYKPSLVPLLDFMRKHPPTKQLKRFLLGSPPPLYSNEELKSRLHREPFYGERAAEAGISMEDIAITPARLRHKLWFTLQTAMAELAAEAGWTFIEVPSECFDEHRFLKMELSAGDCSHANADFGALMNVQVMHALAAEEL